MGGVYERWNRYQGGLLSGETRKLPQILTHPGDGMGLLTASSRQRTSIITLTIRSLNFVLVTRD